MPLTAKTMLLAGSVAAFAALGAVQAEAGHRHLPFGPIGPLGVTDPMAAYPLSEDAADAVEDANEAAIDAAEDAMAAAAAARAVAAAAAAHSMIEDAFDD